MPHTFLSIVVMLVISRPLIVSHFAVWTAVVAIIAFALRCTCTRRAEFEVVYLKLVFDGENSSYLIEYMQHKLLGGHKN